MVAVFIGRWAVICISCWDHLAVKPEAKEVDETVCELCGKPR
jgi:hypothetical protein